MADRLETECCTESGTHDKEEPVCVTERAEKHRKFNEGSDRNFVYSAHLCE